MSDSIYVKVGDAVQQLDLGGNAPEYVQRIEALEGALEESVAAQSTRDSQQDAAIGEARAAAESAADSAVVSAAMDGTDLVLTLGSGDTRRVALPAGKGVGDLWIGHDPKGKPANVQLYAGQLLNRASYAAHSALVLGGARTVLSESAWQAQVAANGFCPFYSSGDGSTTYRMPLVKGVHPQFVAALAEAGQYKAAGLPNITGEWQNWNQEGRVMYNIHANSKMSGAFKLGSVSATRYSGYDNANVTAYPLAFDASLSNAIYGAADTVQPPSLTLLMGEYVVGSVATVGEADSASLLASVTRLEGGKAESDLSNVTPAQSFKTMSVGWGMPDYSAGVQQSLQTEYTATMDGVIQVTLSDYNTTSRLELDGVSYLVAAMSSNQLSFAFTQIAIPRGTRYKVACGRTDVNNFLYFFPLKGA